jgi:hypothetical protein
MYIQYTGVAVDDMDGDTLYHTHYRHLGCLNLWSHCHLTPTCMYLIRRTQLATQKGFTIVSRTWTVIGLVENVPDGERWWDLAVER